MKSYVNFLLPKWESSASGPSVRFIKQNLGLLPCPASISYWWAFGSLLGLCLCVQILSGVILAMHYGGPNDLAFHSVVHIMRDLSLGWKVRVIHANGASVFFICLYLHIARGIYHHSYSSFYTWLLGTGIFISVMATAFLGYVLPWGQMSFWGATVITNLFSAIPMWGEDIVTWLWGGFAVGDPTRARFFSLHYLVPFIIVFLVVLHLLSLHSTGSSNPLGTGIHLDKIPFHPYFTYKDLLGALWLILFLLSLSCFYPWLLGDPDNFFEANSMVTPVHIQPEWYFLFAYAILRSVPNKLGGVIALLLSVVILMALAFFPCPSLGGQSMKMYSSLYAFSFWFLCVLVFLLTWLGARPVEEPYSSVGAYISFWYFKAYGAIWATSYMVKWVGH